MGYNEGFHGSGRLHHAICRFINKYFRPFVPIESDDITCVGGVTELNSLIATHLTDPGQALLLGQPIYGSFHNDLVTESGSLILHAPMGDINQFDEDCVGRYEAALKKARAEGVNVRALVICNPHNPLGACYTPEALKGLMRLCESWELHLVADEIYANSVFDPEDSAKPGFTSVLSFDTKSLISQDRLHVLWGASKDLAVPGLRLGALITRNKELIRANRMVARFHAPAEICGALATQVLEDEHFLEGFLAESSVALARHYHLTRSLLDDAGIHYFKGGRAGFFLWVDLSPYLKRFAEDGWAAEEILQRRFQEAKVLLSSSKAYAAEQPGWFRIILTVPEDMLREGIKRYVQLPFAIRSLSRGP